MRRAGKVDHHRDVAAPQPRRLMQRVRVHDVGQRPAGARSRRHAARQNHSSSRCSAAIVSAAEPARVLPAVDRSRARYGERSTVGVHAGRPDTARRRAAAAAPVMTSTSTPSAVELAHPRQVPRLAAAPHHREAAHQHRYAHARSRDGEPIDVATRPQLEADQRPDALGVIARALLVLLAAAPSTSRGARPAALARCADRAGSRAPSRSALPGTSGAAARRSRASAASARRPAPTARITFAEQPLGRRARRHAAPTAAAPRARSRGDRASGIALRANAPSSRDRPSPGCRRAGSGADPSAAAATAAGPCADRSRAHGLALGQRRRRAQHVGLRRPLRAGSRETPCGARRTTPSGPSAIVLSRPLPRACTGTSRAPAPTTARNASHGRRRRRARAHRRTACSRRRARRRRRRTGRR